MNLHGVQPAWRLNATAKNRPASWGFVCRLYGLPGVERACLGLQDRHHIDITLLLFCIWRVWEFGELVSENDLEAAELAIGPWRREVIEPLRRARRAMKVIDPIGDASRVDVVRCEAMRLELELERIELNALEQLCSFEPEPRGQAGATRVRETGRRFVEAAGGRMDELDKAAVEIIADALDGL